MVNANAFFFLHFYLRHVLFIGIPIVYILAIIPPILPWKNSFHFLSWCKFSKKSLKTFLTLFKISQAILLVLFRRGAEGNF
jgi:hypothetical protein